MDTIGLLGNEFDKCVRLLKVRIEDLGHRARMINLTHLPRVTRATLRWDSLVYDGYELFEIGSFYLKEMGIRDPFFHVSYAPDMWALLRERYLAFIAEEVENVLFTCSLLEILASRVPMINPPRVYSQRTAMPFHFHVLAQQGFSVPAFTTGYEGEQVGKEPAEEMPLSLDEEKTWEVLSFTKGEEKRLRIWRKKEAETTYRLIIIGEKLFDYGLSVAADGTSPSKVDTAQVPRQVTEAAVKAAEAVGIAFGEIMLRYSAREGTVQVLQVDPSPDFNILETVHGLAVSEPLAQHLITVAAQSR